MQLTLSKSLEAFVEFSLKKARPLDEKKEPILFFFKNEIYKEDSATCN